MTEVVTRVKDDTSFGMRVSLFYAALFVFYGTHMPFTPVWLDWCGLSAGDISIIMAAPFFLRLFVTPAVAVLADRSGAHRAYLILFAWIALAFVLALTFARSFWPIFLLAVPLIVCNATILPLVETIAVQGMRLRGLDYGRMRLWGSLSFVAASFAGGAAIAEFGRGSGVWLVALGSALTVLAANALPRQHMPAVPGGETVPAFKSNDIADLLARKEVVLFLAAAGLVQAGHATFLTFGTLLWQKQGFSATWSGTLWAIGVFAEVMLFSMSGRIADKFGAAQLIAIGAAFSILRWLALALEPPIAVLVPLQLLHGVTYGASHIGAIHFIHDAIPRDKQGSAQALYATVAQGIAMGFATVIAGYIYGEAGSASYFAMAAIAVASLAASLQLVRVWNGGAIASSAN